MKPLEILLKSKKNEDKGNDGSIDIDVEGGIQPYSYLWNNGETSQDIQNLKYGNYTITVTDKTSEIVSQSFTINPKINLEDSLSISGYVSAGNLWVTDGYVIAFSHFQNKLIPYSYTTINGDGSFKLINLKVSKYILYAVPSVLYLNNYIPTYYCGQSNWNNAFPINLLGNAYHVLIDLNKIENNKESGLCKIIGKVNFEDDTLCIYSKKNPLFSTSKTANQPVFLIQNEEIISSSLTDSNGVFIFDNIAVGNYKILISNPGFSKLTKEVELTFQNPVSDTIIFDIKKLDVLSTCSADQIITQVYPNPVQTVLYFSKQCDVQLFNMKGEKIKIAKKVQNLNVSSLPLGIYQIVLINNDGVFTHLIIKQ